MQTKTVQCDLLIIGGGMAGAGAAYEASCWGKGLRIVMVDKARIERSGATAQGLSSLNCYLGSDLNENTPEDFVKYVRSDSMGITREDLVYDIARHVDDSVQLLEEWGLPIVKDPVSGKYKRTGRFQVLVHGESIKPIVAEVAKKSVSYTYEGVMITHLLTDDKDSNKIAGAAGFDSRDGTFYVFRSKSVIIGAGGATHIFPPHAAGEGWGKTWYPPWSSGSAYGLISKVGGEMTMMENKLVLPRMKDGFGSVGNWLLSLRAKTTNNRGEEYESRYTAEQRKLYGKYVDTNPLPTSLRDDAMFRQIRDGKAPIMLHTEQTVSSEDKVKEGWENALDMTVSQSLVWASQEIDPQSEPSELVLSEPYIMGSHASQSGAWVSGPPDIAPSDYEWGYNRMTTVRGLFAAGDAVGGCGHKFSSGSFTEGRIAAKSAIKYILDHPNEKSSMRKQKIERIKLEIYRPVENDKFGRAIVSGGSVSPVCLSPYNGLLRLEKIMGDYCGGAESMYMTNDAQLTRGLRSLGMLHEDLQYLCADDFHELQRAWELEHRVWTAETVMRHTMAREETRWPIFCSRSDYEMLDDKNWHVFVNTRYSPGTGEWTTHQKPVISIIS